jgi:ATP-dependent RNA helicase DHX37/DHR1
VRRALDGFSRSRKRRRISRNADISVGESGDGSDDDSDEHTVAEHALPKHREDLNPPASVQHPLPQELRRTHSPPEYAHSTSGTSEKLPITNISAGSGLKRNADGTVIAPRVVPRRPKPSREVRAHIPHLLSNVLM